MKKLNFLIVVIILILSLFISPSSKVKALSCCTSDADCSAGMTTGTCTARNKNCTSGRACVFSENKYDSYNDAIGIDETKIDVSTLGGILSAFFPYLLTIAGLILFAMLIAGGFTMLTGAANKESQEKGKKILTSALTGFFILFLAYWIAQILQVIFKINIVS
ncbi:MAG: hypothetical protein ABII80_00390 [bacterium]